MAKYKIYFKESVKKDFKPISKINTRKILQKIDSLAEEPRPFGCEKLTDQETYKRPVRKPFYKLLPLHELIALAKASSLASKKTWSVYNHLIEKFGNEFSILLDIGTNDLNEALPDNPLLVQLIIDNRIGNIKVKPGYDGKYGEAMLKEKQEKLF